MHGWEPEILRPETKELKLKYQWKFAKGKHVSVERPQREGYQWKAKGQFTKGSVCSFRHDENQCGKTTQSLLLIPNRRLKTTGFFLKGIFLEAAVFLERDLEVRAKTTSVEIVRISHVIFVIFPNVNITKHIRDANSVKSAFFMHEQVDSQLTKNPKKIGGKGSFVWWKNSKQSDCVFQWRATEIQVDFTEEHKMFQTEAQCGTLRHVKIRERKDPSKGVNSGLHERRFRFQKLKTDLRKKLWNENDAPGESRRNCLTVSTVEKKRIKPHSSLFQTFGHCQRYFRRNLRKRICGIVRSFTAHVEQEISTLSAFGHFSCIQNHHNVSYSQRCNAKERGRSSVRLRSRFVRDAANLRGYASSSLVWKVLRWSRIFWLGYQKSKIFYIKNGWKYNAKLKITYRSCRPALPCRLQVHPQHRQCGT